MILICLFDTIKLTYRPTVVGEVFASYGFPMIVYHCNRITANNVGEADYVDQAL